MDNKYLSLIRKYKALLSALYVSNSKNYNRLLKWLHQFVHLKSIEHSFKPNYLPKYEQGQIIFLDFGCGVGREFSYPHYAIVINNDDRKKNHVLTVVPLTSKKEKHNNLRPWEYELSRPVKSLLAEKAFDNFNGSAAFVQLQKDAAKLASNADQYSLEDYKKQYEALIEKGVATIVATSPDVMNLHGEMKEGSIVVSNHIRTIDKSRIRFPQKASHPLYGIKIHKDDLTNILFMHTKSILPAHIDK